MRTTRMTRLRFAMLFVLLACSARLGAQAANPGALLQIMQPRAGAKLAQTFVSVEYRITNPAIPVAGSPNFLVQLDTQSPVSTATTSQTFYGLTPGAHTV
ncbi:MAG: hypothetical protein JO041_15390, partial [Acidobacteria bacterium]|nr:hypothetical protein [Acidobacteriota bacterium]